MTNSKLQCFAYLAALAAAMTLGACHLEPAHSSDGLDNAAIADEVRDDYALFAQRCSKCHTLARPLQSGITSDEYWEQYVARMRRQPGSGISPDEVAPILRFLHYYSTDVRAREAARAGSARPANPVLVPVNEAGAEPDAS